MLELNHDDLKDISIELLDSPETEVKFPVSKDRSYTADVANNHTLIECKPWSKTIYLQFKKIAEVPLKKILFMQFPSIFDELWLVSATPDPTIRLYNHKTLTDAKKTHDDVTKYLHKLYNETGKASLKVKELQNKLEERTAIKNTLEKELTREQKIAFNIRIDITTEKDPHKCIVCGLPSDATIIAEHGDYGICKKHMARIINLSNKE